jgi:acyl CoA:acetate/3-ketoacid CoA transferase alpha subunit
MSTKDLSAFIDAKFRVPVVEGEDKVCPLSEAIKRNVCEGMTIHSAGRTGALNYQLVREFWGKKPDFTFISYAMSGTLLSLIQGRLIKKAITSFAGNGYPSPAPNPLVQKAYISRAVEFENWTMLTIPLRLLAGAMGWDVMPTRSILGSSMEEENKESFLAMRSPFADGGTVGLMSALRPDVTLLHGAVADRCGNTIMTYPLGNDVFGAWAANRGVVVSVDRIVSTEYIRRYAHLVRIPSYLVSAVCEVPYGAHPTGVTCNGLPEFEAYADDYDFFNDVTVASTDEEKFKE